MRCEDVGLQLADYLTGSLTAEDTEALDEHLRGCPACTRVVDDLRSTWDLLGSVPGLEPDSEAMRARLDTARAAFAQGLEDTGHASAYRWHEARWWGAGLTAAAALLLLGVLIGRTGAPAAVPAPELTSLRQELQSTRQLVMLTLLQQQSASNRLKGVSWSEQLEQPGDEVVSALLDTLLHDPNVNVRLASVDALKRFGARDQVRRGALEALAERPSPLVQLALIDFVVEINESEATTVLRELSEDPELDASVRTHAAWGLEQLSQLG